MSKKLKDLLVLVFIFTSLIIFAQQPVPSQKVKVSGKVIEKVSKQPLEYATITLINAKNPKALAGGITNAKGEYNIDVTPGIYDVNIEFISFKPNEIKQKSIQENINMGTTALDEDAAQLNEVVVRAEKTTVEIKLDKKVYNVGSDLMVKGGTVSDVLDNIPSVSVDVEGNVSLRGNDNVRIFIDGRPSNAINMAEALRQIPADAIDKVEVITNPSARYDAEGGAGILNILLKKGRNQGFNGSFTASTGLPETYGLSANLNYKTEKLNFFTSTGYNYRNMNGGGKTNTHYLNTDGTTKNFIDEVRDTERLRKGLNSNIGVEWVINPTTFWTNSINYRNNKGDDTDFVNRLYFDQNRDYTSTHTRLNNNWTTEENIEFSSNFIKNFNDKGHKLTIDGLISKDKDNDDALITDRTLNSTIDPIYNTTLNHQKQDQAQFQADYVLPIGKGSQFEAGYKGNFNTLENLFNVGHTLEYKEKINALYTQYGFKVNKFSYLFGLRWEDSAIDVNLIDDNNYNKKRYNNFFPSAFINYEISDKSGLSLSYSKRLSRPRGRFMNPFTNYSSDINIFRGNPDLDPSLTDKFDFGYIKRWDKVTFNTSLYYQNTTDVFTFVRLETGDFVSGTPVILSTPINLGKEQQYGFEFTLNYSPYKWWRLNSNLNLFNVKTTGDYTYINSVNENITQNFDSESLSWFARISSKVTLPYKIDWQTNMMYMGGRKTAQGKSLGQFGTNIALSKDILKDKATIAFNVSDLFNSRIMKNYTYLDNANSYSEMQFRKRQFNLSFTYRMNKKKNEKEKNPPKNENNESGGDFPG